jgi:hypothetical protein
MACPKAIDYGKEAACVIAEARRMHYAVATIHQAKLVNLGWVQIQDRYIIPIPGVIITLILRKNPVETAWICIFL